MLKGIIYSPPVIFAGFLGIIFLMMRFFARYTTKGNASERALDPYACGQKDFENYVNPNYTQFFRYAFVFTVMHVLALVITTAAPGATALPLAYVAAGVLALLIIFRK